MRGEREGQEGGVQVGLSLEKPVMYACIRVNGLVIS